MQSAVRPYGTVHQLSLRDRQFLLLWGQEELRYHPKRAEQIDEAQSIDDFLSLPYREPFTPMAEPQVKAQILT